MDDGEPNQKPTPPPIQSGNEVKIPMVKFRNTLIFVVSDRKITSFSNVEIPSPTAPIVGYTGVRLSVAFCSFVI